jgi:hypothetical protein
LPRLSCLPSSAHIKSNTDLENVFIEGKIFLLIHKKRDEKREKKEIENISFSWRERSGKRARIKTSTRGETGEGVRGKFLSETPLKCMHLRC